MKERTTLARWTPRRLLSLLMALIMTLSLLPTAALAAAPKASNYSITFDAPERMVVGTKYTDARAEVTIGSSITADKLTVEIDGPDNGCTIAYGANSITNSTSVTTPQDLANLGTISTVTQALHVEPISLEFTKAGEYKVTLAVIDGSTTETSVTKTFYVSDITSPTTTITPISAVEGEPFDVTVNTSYPGNSVFFEYGTETQTVQVSARPDGKGYATARFTAKNATPAPEVKATLFNPDIPGFRSNEVTIPVNVTSAATPATSHTVTFLAGAADAYIPFVATATVAHGDDYTIPAAEPTRKGYTFVGWMDGATPYAAGGTISGVTKDIVLSAKWTATPVTVTFPLATDLPTGVTIFPTAGSITSSVDSVVHFNVKVPDKYNTADLQVSAGHFGSTYRVLAPVARYETADSVTLYYQFTVTEDLVDPATSKLDVTVSNFIEKTFTVMMPTGHFNAEITGATPAPTTTTAGSTVATDKKSASIVYGGSYTFTVTPDPGYDVAVYVNGVKQTAGTGNSYTVAPVTGPQSVAVVESAIPNYNVTFTVPLSGEFFTQSVARGKTASRPGVAPEREGYTFEGWYDETAYNTPGGTEFNFSTPITKDTVLYGKLTPNIYTITYNANNGTFATGAATTTQSKTHGLALQLITDVPTRAGYTFLGWGMTATATAANYKPGDPYSVDGTTTLYAVWKENTYTVTLPTGQGYSINTAQSTTVTHGGNFEFTVTVDRLYAAAAPTVKVNGTLLPATSPDGTPNTDGSITYTYKITDIQDNQVVSVNVTKNSVYTVTFMTGTAVYQTQEVGHGEKATRPVDPVVEGYTFDGWYKESTCDNAWNFATDTVIGPTTIYAKLTAIEPVITWPTATTGYTIEVKGTASGATAETTLNNNDKVNYGSTVTFTIEILDGYDASQMQVGINGQLLAPKEINGDVYIFEFTAKENTKITVVGVARKTVTIIYNDNGGYGGPVQETVNYYLLNDTNNGKISKTEPTREGYDFKGWSTDNKATWDAATNKITHETGVTATDLQPDAESPFTSDTVLYAVWQAKETGIDLKVDKTEQYEGEDVTLTATITSGTASVTTGSVQFYRSTDGGTKWTQFASAVVSGGTAIYKAKTSDFVYGGTNKDTYKAVFIPTEGNGYTEITSATEAVTVKSTAISWKLDAAPKIDADANVLTITDKNGDPVTAMVAGQVYTLKLPAIYALDDLGTQLTVNKDYSVTWQYRNDKGVWTDYTNSGSGDTTTVDAAYSQYVFRAVVTPVTGATSHFTKAAKYTTDGALDKDKYETALISASTTEVDLQGTTTALAITGADDEAANVTINGNTPFNTTGEHKAQFEGQKVTLTATVTDTTTGTPAVTTGYVNFYRKGATADTLLNASPIAVGTNGVATCEVTISNWDTNKTADNNKDQFYAVYQPNATYNTSDSKADLKAVYIKSTAIQTPIIESKLEGEGGKKATTYTDDLTGLLAGVQHEFKLRTGNAEPDWSVVALDGRTVEAKNYDIEWQYKQNKTNDNFAKAGNDSTEAIYTTKTTEVGDQYRVVLKAKGDMKTDATSKFAEIGKKQDVTVTVEASDEIASTPVDRVAKKFPDVYQLNKIELTATVKGYDSEIMTPTGTVKFYYKDRQVTPNTFVYLGEATLEKGTDGKMHASIETDKLPVDKDENTKLDVVVCAAYFGDDTFAASKNVSAGNIASAGSTGYVTYDTVTVYSSVVFAGNSENKATTTPSTDGITITANGKLKANESSVTLTLGQVYTLDHPIDLSKLTYNTDYTVQWQILKNALQYQDVGATGSYATTDKWEDLSGQTGMSYTGTMEQDAAYRAKITVKDTPIAKGSFTKVNQAIEGRDVYYSNVLVVGVGMATVTTNITTSANQKFNEEGIVSGETATIHVLASGAAKTTPISTVTATITKRGETEPVFNEKANNVNGYTSFAWDTANLTPGYYTLTVTAESNNGYAPQTITRTLIVRDNAYTLKATKESKVYNGKAQGIDWALTGVDIEDALAQKSVVVYYYDKDGKMVEPTQAGKYQYDLYLPASAYWTELTHITGTFIIEKRKVEVVDLVAQAKVYDGTKNANIQEIILNDATVDPTTGLPTDTDLTGIIDGDSVYAVGTGYTDKATAGTDATLGVKDVTLRGDDAANYVLVNSGHTEEFNIQRSQVKGAIVSGRTYKYTGKDIKLAASDIYLIDQAGSQLTDYDVTYYYHNGDGVEKVDAMNKMGKYTVIARPEQDNYKGGATETVYVGTADNAGTLVTSAVSSLITISNTVELYGATTGVTVSATKGTATASYYYNDGTSADWHTDVPANAGRYLVKVTTSTGDTAYGLYTVVKARPALTLTATGATYNSAQYNGAPTGTYNGGTLPADTYFTYTGGTIQGVAYEAPTEAGDYVVTAHVGKTPNYTAHEISTNFTIAKAALTIKADDLQRWQYGSFPDMVASYQGLATSGVAADTSLRDVQIQPEFLFNEKDGGYTNHAFDQVGTYPVTVRNALARNYTVTYVGGTIATTKEEPKAKLAIHGMPDNGTATENLVYYGDTIQLYAYGYYKTLNGDGQGSYNTSSLIEWSVSDASIAEIDQSGLLTIKGVGTFTVTLTRGSGSAAISTDISVTAEKQEVKVVVPAEDKVYDGNAQTYTTANGYAVNGKFENVTSDFNYNNTTRTNVGSQIVTGKVLLSDPKYVSETYGGLFTINVKNVSVTPNEISVIYGEALGTPGTPGTLGYSESGTVSGVPALTDGKAVSEREDYKNLDVLDGYEILVAGRENENYNVKYVTDQTAPDVKVTAKDLIIKTGTLNSDGRTSGYLKENDQFYKNEGFAITGTTFNLAPNDRMYGEVNPVMDYTFADFVSGDSEADFDTMLPWLVKYSKGTYHNINGDANVAFDKVNHLSGSRATSFMSGMSAYPIDSMLLPTSVKNYTLTSTEATQNIYQRPVTLTVPTGVTLTAYKPTIIDSSGVKTDVLLDLLLNNLEVGKYNSEGGLAELLKHTIKDLKIQIVSATYDDTTKTISVIIELGNKNYWTENLSFTVKVDPTKIVAKYGPLGWTSASVTMVGVDESGHETGPVDVSGKVWYEIYVKNPSITNPKYSDYKGTPYVHRVEMIKGSSTGVYIANYPSLPAGEYVMFAIAEEYTIIE